MKYLILVISSACLLQVGQSRPSYSGGYGGSEAHSGYGSSVHAPVGYQGPLAKPYVLPDGHIADTPEVAAAKHQHYSAVQKAKADSAAHGYSGDDGSYRQGRPSFSGDHYSGGHSGYGNAVHAPVGYHGPLAKPYVLSDGHIADTPEVSAAKHLHYTAVQKARAEAATHGYSGDEYDGSYGSGGQYNSGTGYGSNYGYGAGYGSSHESGLGYGSSHGSGAGYAGGYSYSGPLAYPKVLSSGQLADTHEVAAAKHAHLKAVAVTAREHAEKWGE